MPAKKTPSVKKRLPSRKPQFASRKPRRVSSASAVVFGTGQVIVLVFLVLLMVSVILFYDRLYPLLFHVRTLVEGAGAFGPLVFIAAMALAFLTPLPYTPLAIVSGALFGQGLGFLYTLIGGSLGAMAAFLVSRYVLGTFIRTRLIRAGLERHVHHIVKSHDKALFGIVFFARLIPLTGFDIVSYAAGISRMKPFQFYLATILGMAPVVFLQVLYGSVLAISRWVSAGFLLVAIALLLLLSFYPVEEMGAVRRFRKWQRR